VISERNAYLGRAGREARPHCGRKMGNPAIHYTATPWEYFHHGFFPSESWFNR
jgi:hypothetical protein